MNVIDCFMYFDEDMILDIRLNILDKFVEKFVICEASFNHNGSKKILKFDINKFQKFKSKIIYLPLENLPENLKLITDTDSQIVKNSKTLDNALIRENYQRNFLQSKIKDFKDDDLIMISDVDEIPNLKNFKYKTKITFFEQKMFYYKLNLFHPDLLWYGSKICKKKHLISPQWLRNIKPKKYPFWRFDTFFSKTKYKDISFLKDGGWHFTNIKSPEQIDYKMKNFLHHLEYEESGISVKDLKRIISERRVFYDHKADKKSQKWSASIKLKKELDAFLPDYINLNKDKFKNWLE